MDRGVQTSRSLSANSPRMLQLKRKVKSAEAAVKRLRQRLNVSEQQLADSGKNRNVMLLLKILVHKLIVRCFVLATAGIAATTAFILLSKLWIFLDLACNRLGPFWA